VSEADDRQGNRQNPSRAVALRYRPPRDGAPRVVATGRGYMAQRLVETALSAGVPIVRDPALSALLQAVELDCEVPPDLYVALAEVLAFVYSLNREWQGLGATERPPVETGGRGLESRDAGVSCEQPGSSTAGG